MLAKSRGLSFSLDLSEYFIEANNVGCYSGGPLDPFAPCFGRPRHLHDNLYFLAVWNAKVIVQLDRLAPNLSVTHPDHAPVLAK
ncbi:MAG: hypothetical protein WD403_10430 [Pirellulales bacterium]